MILDFGLVKSENDVGPWAGFLGSMFYVGQLCSSFAWGVLSDRIGKRRVLLSGSFGTLLTCMAFGFSPNYWVAMVRVVYIFVIFSPLNLFIRAGYSIHGRNLEWYKENIWLFSLTHVSVCRKYWDGQGEKQTNFLSQSLFFLKNLFVV